MSYLFHEEERPRGRRFHVERREGREVNDWDDNWNGDRTLDLLNSEVDWDDVLDGMDDYLYYQVDMLPLRGDGTDLPEEDEEDLDWD